MRSSITILLAEDEESLLHCLKTMLEREGHSVIAATNARKALALAKEHGDGIDMIITDVIMPEMNGRELVVELTPLYPNIKVLFMTAHSGDILSRRGMLDEEINLIQKPFSKKAFLDRVAEVLAGD